MRVLLYLLPLAFLAGLAAAQEPDKTPGETPEPTPKDAPEKSDADETPAEAKEADAAAKVPAAQAITVALEAKNPDATTKIAYSKARSMVIESTVPRFLFEIPEFKAKDPLFFRVGLGETKGKPFYAALDRSDETGEHDLLYLDLDRDLDLTNDGEPLRGEVSVTAQDPNGRLVEFLDVTMQLPYTIDGKSVAAPYRCAIYYFRTGKEPPKAVQLERDSWREGEATIDGQKYRIVVIDDDSDGQFATGDSWVFAPIGHPLARLLNGDVTRAMTFPTWTTDQKFTIDVKTIDPAGRWLKIEASPAKETEEQFLTRMYRKRQSPLERQLDINPLRPKAAKNQKIDWLRGKEIKYALDIAQNLDKRVLVQFGGRDQGSARLAQFTYRDREVVDLAKRFVCIFVAFKKGSDAVDKYNVAGSPTCLVLDNNGTEITRLTGFIKPTAFAAFLKSGQR